MSDLVADECFLDPEWRQCQEKILTLLEKHRAKITSIRPPLSHLEAKYLKTIRNLEKMRGISLWFPYVGSGMGNGALVELADGSIKYDFISGVGVHFSHSHPLVIKTALEAAIQNITMQGNLQQNQDSLELCKLLVDTSGLDHCILSSSGAMAVENGLKLVLQKKSPASRILAFEKCFAGRTLALSQITDKPQFREGLPTVLAVDYVPFYSEKDPKGSTEAALKQLKKHLKRYPKQHACMIFEMVQGEGGYFPGSTDFFVKLMSVLKEEKIAIFVDEIQSFGRLDTLFAYQHFQLSDSVDIVSVGKLSQACATLYRKEYQPKQGLISQTFTASTSAIRCGCAIIKNLIHDHFLGSDGKNMQLSRYFVSQLQKLENLHPDLLEGPFGYGLMIAFTPLKGDSEKVKAFLQELFKAGVIGFIAGAEPTRVRFLVPAGGVTNKDIDEVVKILEKTLQLFK